MATFYGEVKGNAQTLATRTGTKSSGIETRARSYSGSVIVWMRMVKGSDVPEIALYTSRESSAYGTHVFDGKIEELEHQLKIDLKSIEANLKARLQGVDDETMKAIEEVFEEARKVD